MARSEKINKLLQKKQWTGEEVGKVLIISLLNDIERMKGGAGKPLLAQEDFVKMEQTLSTDEDLITYGCYRDIATSVTEGYNKGLSMVYRFYSGLHYLHFNLLELYNSDLAEKEAERLPQIVTSNQHIDMILAERKRQQEYQESFASLLFNTLEVFLIFDEKGFQTPPKVQQALKDLKARPATESPLASLYNLRHKRGYYELPDGSRSRIVTSEEEASEALGELLTEHDIAPIMGNIELFFKGADAIRAAVRRATDKLGMEDLTERYTDQEVEEIMEEGATIAALSGNLDDLPEEIRLDVLPEWHSLDDLPEGLTFYDLLDTYKENYHHDKREGIKALRRDARALYDALKEYMEERIPEARGLKANQLHKNLISWGDLAMLQYLTYERYVNGSTPNIAVLHEHLPELEDERGYYKAPANPLSNFKSLLTVNEPVQRENNMASMEHIIAALSYTYAFNDLLGVLGEVYDLPGLQEIASLDTKRFENDIREFNEMIYLFYYGLQGDKVTKRSKRATFKKLFSPIEAEEYLPTDHDIEAVKNHLKTLGFSVEARRILLRLNDLIDLLKQRKEAQQ